MSEAEFQRESVSTFVDYVLLITPPTALERERETKQRNMGKWGWFVLLRSSIISILFYFTISFYSFSWYFNYSLHRFFSFYIFDFFVVYFFNCGLSVDSETGEDEDEIKAYWKFCYELRFYGCLLTNCQKVSQCFRVWTIHLASQVYFTLLFYRCIKIIYLKNS